MGISARISHSEIIAGQSAELLLLYGERNYRTRKRDRQSSEFAESHNHTGPVGREGGDRGRGVVPNWRPRLSGNLVAVCEKRWQSQRGIGSMRRAQKADPAI